MQHIAILDFGSQYTHLIARRIRELEVLAKIYPAETKADELEEEVIGIILSGGPQSVYDIQSPQLDEGIFAMGVPILGLCYGHQLIAKTLGGSVETGRVREYGRAQLSVADTTSILAEVAASTQVWMSHGDTVTSLPEGFTVLGKTDDCAYAAVANTTKQIYGFQFHPEVHHSTQGTQMLTNFVFIICQAQKNWNIENIVSELNEHILKQVGTRKVFLLVSGGVDSSVAYALLSKALGKDRVYGLYVDTGFMRKNESQDIKQYLTKAGFDNLHVLDASETFYTRLEGMHDPEEKRKHIGQAFLDVKDEVAKDLGLDSDEWMLGQGTIYPDTIETGGTKHADTIKTHHNRVDAIQKLIEEGKVIEPIADFYKDEVRHIGTLLGLPEHMIQRHPFPGPGLAIRILCTDTTQTNESISLDVEITLLNGLNHAVLPMKSVGVQGDNRTYAHPLALWGTKDWDTIDTLSSTITNASRVVNRTMVLLNPIENPVFALAPSQKKLTKKRTQLLQEIDAIVMNIITDAGLYNEIWQLPVVLIPIGHTHFESIVLRPVVSQEAMTAHFARIPEQVLQKIIDAIIATSKIDYVFYDTTNKPPGTIEWE